MSGREEILRAGLTKTNKIIEIGPSFNPLTPKRDGWRSFSVDHADREGLVDKYRHDPSVDVALIEPVDFVWTEGGLSDAVPIEHHGTFDVFLASHVIEHIPDLIEFLTSAEVLCRPDARMILAIPDKRLCFDFFRPLSTTGDALEAHWQQRSRHSPKTLWDYFAYQVTSHGGRDLGRTDQPMMRFTYSINEAAAWTRKHDSGTYIDAHCWIFVPASFALMMLELARLGLIDWHIERIEEAEYTEFYVWLCRGARARAAAISETDLVSERMRLLRDIALELEDQGRRLVPNQSLERDLAREDEGGQLTTCMQHRTISTTEAALRYLLAFDDIEGALSLDTALMMIELGWEQRRLDLDCGMAEIGIHHGKSFLALAATAAPDEALFAIDVFERQDLNIDQSGAGDRGRFAANLARFFPSARVRIIAASSASLREHEVEHGLVDLRFFSIDGGHTQALTLNDLQIADVALGCAGVCALDDILNPHWTGVLSGLFAYFAAGGALVPFALVPNKLLLCRPDWVIHYRDFMRNTFSYARERSDQEFDGHRIDVYGAAWPRVPETLRKLAALLQSPDHVAVVNPQPEVTAARTQLNEAERQRTAALAEEVTASAKLRDALAEAERLIAGLRSSTSWRVTAPLRGLVRLIRGR